MTFLKIFQYAAEIIMILQIFLSGCFKKIVAEHYGIIFMPLNEFKAQNTFRRRGEMDEGS
jgi:hypothetical protein